MPGTMWVLNKVLADRKRSVRRITFNRFFGPVRGRGGLSTSENCYRNSEIVDGPCSALTVRLVAPSLNGGTIVELGALGPESAGC